MAGSGFQVFKKTQSDVLEKFRALASTAYVPGDLLTVVANVATKAAATDVPTHLYVGMEPLDSQMQLATNNLSTAAQEFVLAIPIGARRAILKSYLTGDAIPLINGVAANTNAVTTAVLATTATTDNDYDNGELYCPELGEQRSVTDSQETGGVTTFTVAPGFSRAVTAGDTIIVVPYSKGLATVKLNATTPQQCISNAIADKTGGYMKIEDVNLKGDNRGPFVLVSC